jgi:hypothetical protein
VAIPVISVAKNGLPVSAAAAPFGYPVTVSTNGFGLAVMPVAFGGRPVFDTSGTLFGAAVIPANLTVPVISGTTRVGQTLSTSSGTWSGSAATYTYQWKRGGTNIVSATLSTYLLVSADNGTNITVTVTATNSAGNASATSAAVGPITLGLPVNTTLPVISGATITGSTLTTTDGVWTGSLPITYSYQWFKDGALIGGASLNNYTLVPTDLGSLFTVAVKATNSFGFSTVGSAAVGPVTVGGVAPSTPVLTWISDATDLTPEGTVTFDNVPVAGDILTSQIATAGTSFISPIINNIHTITVAEDTGNSVSLANTPLVAGSYDWRVKVTHAGVDSAWSNTQTKVLTGFSPSMLTPTSWFEVGKGGLFQLIAGTTPAVANNDVVGFMPDQSGNTFTLTAPGNDTTRPTLQGVGTFPYLNFDGSNDTLLRAAAVGTPASSFTWAICLRSNSNAVSTRVMCAGNSTQGNTIFSNIEAASATATSSSMFWRNDTSTSFTGQPAGNNFLNAGVFDGTDKVIVVTFDVPTLTIQTYVGSAASGIVVGATNTIAAPGTYTCDRFSLGSLVRFTVLSGSNFWAGRIYGTVTVNSVLSTTDRNNLIHYLGALAGLNL